VLKMGGGASVSVRRDIQTLFDSGTASGLTDRQLLERFVSGRDESAEAAFTVLVQRHGPMVLRVCHNVLGDATDAQDAFQATFLVLVKRRGSIRRLESLGSWLYGVACRVSARARVEAAKRRAAERRGALRVVQAVDSSDGEQTAHADFGPVIQEEVRRLPEKYRAVVALCYWQGLTHEQAATQLGCPLGTVRSRLARARDKLHTRLTRRGLAPLAAGMAAALDGSSASASAFCAAAQIAIVPSGLVQSTIHAAVQVAVGQPIARVLSAVTESVVQKVLWNMTMIRICKIVSVLSLVCLVVVGVGLWAQPPELQRRRPRPEHVVQEKTKAPEQPKSGIAHVVEPPDLVIVEVLDALPGRPISGERLVRPDGTVSLGFYGDVHVAGLTVPEVKAKIILHLQKILTDEALGLVNIDETGNPEIDPNTGKTKLFDPKDSITVFVDVTAYNSRNYYVQGDVHIPGRLPYTGNETVLDVLSFVGGIMPSADRAKIKLIRSYPKGSPVQALPVDFEEITMGTDSSTNYQILPNDRLVVPRAVDYQQTQVSPRSPARPGIHRPDTTTYFPGLGTDDPDNKQLSSLRAVERHLSEVEKKLDKIILEMESAKRSRREKADVKAPAEAGAQSPNIKGATPESASKPE
jgi:polysaccharide biosynthesis/export protein